VCVCVCVCARVEMCGVLGGLHGNAGQVSLTIEVSSVIAMN